MVWFDQSERQLALPEIKLLPKEEGEGDVKDMIGVVSPSALSLLIGSQKHNPADVYLRRKGENRRSR